MLIDRPQITESSNIVNATVPSGSSFPLLPSVGELFFHTGLGTLNIFNTSWNESGLTPLVTAALATLTADVAALSGNNSTALATHAADGTLHLSAAQNTLLDGLAATLTSTELNYVDGVTSPIQTQLDTLTANKLNVSGGTITGALTVNGVLTAADQLLLSGDPTAPFGAATKQYVDSAIAGLYWKNSAAAATSVNITLSGLQLLDNYQLVNGDRVLVKNQSNASQNGIYTASAAAWSRSADANTGSELEGAAIFVRNGPIHGNTAWSQTAVNIVLGTTPLAWSQFSSGGTGAVIGGTGINVVGQTVSVAASDGLTFSGNNLVVNPAPRLTVSTGQLDLADIHGGVTTVRGGSSSTLQISYDEYGRVTSSQAFTLNTDTIAQGSTNFFFSNALAQAAISVSGAGLSKTGGTITLNSAVGATAGTVVVRDGSGGFSASTIVGNLIGSASLNVLKTGDTMTGDLVFSATRGIQLGGATAKVFTPSTNVIAVTTNNVERVRVADTGAVGMSGANYGTPGQILTSAGPTAPPSWQNSPSGLFEVVVVTGLTQQAASMARYVLTNTAGVTTLTLPAAPNVGDTLIVYNFTGRLDPVLARNGNPIQSLPEDLIMDVNVSFEVTYVDPTIGWAVKL